MPKAQLHGGLCRRCLAAFAPALLCPHPSSQSNKNGTPPRYLASHRMLDAKGSRNESILLNIARVSIRLVAAGGAVDPAKSAAAYAAVDAARPHLTDEKLHALEGELFKACQDTEKLGALLEKRATRSTGWRNLEEMADANIQLSEHYAYGSDGGSGKAIEHAERLSGLLASCGPWLAWLPELYEKLGLPADKQLWARVNHLSHLVHSNVGELGLRNRPDLARHLADLDHKLGDALAGGTISAELPELGCSFHALCAKFLACSADASADALALRCLLSSSHPACTTASSMLRESEIAHIVCTADERLGEARTFSHDLIETALGNALAPASGASYMRSRPLVAAGTHPLETAASTFAKVEALYERDLKIVQTCHQDLDKLVFVFKSWLSLLDVLPAKEPPANRQPVVEALKQGIARLMTELSQRLPEATSNPRARKVVLDEWVVYIWTLAQRKHLQETKITPEGLFSPVIRSTIAWDSTTAEQKEFFANQNATAFASDCVLQISGGSGGADGPQLPGAFLFGTADLFARMARTTLIARRKTACSQRAVQYYTSACVALERGDHADQPAAPQQQQAAPATPSTPLPPRNAVARAAFSPRARGSSPRLRIIAELLLVAPDSNMGHIFAAIRQLFAASLPFYPECIFAAASKVSQ